MFLRVLGMVDLIGGMVFLLMAMNISVFWPLVLFSMLLIFTKGLFVFVGDKLSYVDLVLSLLLFLSLFFTLPGMIAGTGSLILLAKGFASFA